MSVRNLVIVSMAIMAVAVAVVANPAVAAEIYNLDPVHTQPIFEVQHMGYSLQRGTFTGATGKVTLDRDAKKGSIDVTIDTTTVRTSDSRLDTIVKAEDFFNVTRYPTMSFKSTALAFDGDRVVGADGTLTMLGVTRPVKLKVDNFVCGLHPFTKNPLCGAAVTTP